MKNYVIVATVLTVYGIETKYFYLIYTAKPSVATVLTVYGIETFSSFLYDFNSSITLQQYLPFTVLKLITASAV